MASKHAWKVDLIPWDHMSDDQVTRLYDQRVACGWRSHEVLSWVDSAKKGGRLFYWVVLSDAVPDRDDLLATHAQAYPQEASPLRDTAREVRLAPRIPTNKDFVPIGHVALKVHSAEEDAKLGLPSEGVIWVHQLYVSYVLQRGGFGAAAMDQVEALAAQAPFNGKMTVLDTVVAKSQVSSTEMMAQYKDMGIPVPAISNQEWYIRRGYELFHKETMNFTGQMRKQFINFDVVFLRKMCRPDVS